MKTYEKALLALYSLLIMAIAIFIAAVSFEPVYLTVFSNYLSSNTGRITAAIVSLLFFIMGFKTLLSSFSKKMPQLISIQTTDLGAVNITVTALDHLVSKAAKQIKEVKEIKSKVKPQTDGVLIFLNAGVSTESNLPFVTRELQDTIKGYIEQIAGINVLEVKVLVNYITQETKLRVE